MTEGWNRSFFLCLTGQRIWGFYSILIARISVFVLDLRMNLGFARDERQQNEIANCDCVLAPSLADAGKSNAKIIIFILVLHNSNSKRHKVAHPVWCKTLFSFLHLRRRRLLWCFAQRNQTATTTPSENNGNVTDAKWDWNVCGWEVQVAERGYERGREIKSKGKWVSEYSFG